jgi:hypothetical protein
MKEIIPRFFARIALLIFGISALFVVSYFLFLCSHPTDYARVEEAFKKKIGNQYELNLEKGKLLNRLSPAHPASDASSNLSDSLFVLYFYPSNDPIELKALVRILVKDENYTLIKFDSIIGYEYRANFNSHEISKIINNYDSLDFVDQFYKNVIRKIITDSIENTQVYYDNKLVLETFKK